MVVACAGAVECEDKEGNRGRDKDEVTNSYAKRRMIVPHANNGQQNQSE